MKKTAIALLALSLSTLSMADTHRAYIDGIVSAQMGKKNQNVTVMSRHCYNIQNHQNTKKHYFIHEEIRYNDFVNVREENLELNKNNEAKFCRDNNLKLNIPEAGTYTIKSFGQVSGDAEARSDEQGMLFIN